MKAILLALALLAVPLAAHADPLIPNQGANIISEPIPNQGAGIISDPSAARDADRAAAPHDPADHPGAPVRH